MASSRRSSFNPMSPPRSVISGEAISAADDSSSSSSIIGTDDDEYPDDVSEKTVIDSSDSCSVAENVSVTSRGQSLDNLDSAPPSFRAHSALHSLITHSAHSAEPDAPALTNTRTTTTQTSQYTQEWVASTLGRSDNEQSWRQGNYMRWGNSDAPSEMSSRDDTIPSNQELVEQLTPILTRNILSQILNSLVKLTVEKRSISTQTVITGPVCKPNFKQGKHDPETTPNPLLDYRSEGNRSTVDDLQHSIPRFFTDRQPTNVAADGTGVEQHYATEDKIDSKYQNAAKENDVEHQVAAPEMCDAEHQTAAKNQETEVTKKTVVEHKIQREKAEIEYKRVTSTEQIELATRKDATKHQKEATGKIDAEHQNKATAKIDAKHQNAATGKLDAKHQNVAGEKIDAKHQNGVTGNIDAKYRNVPTGKTDAKQQNVVTENIDAKHQNVATGKVGSKHHNEFTGKTDGKDQNVAPQKADVNYHPKNAKDAIMARQPRPKRKPGEAHHLMIRNGRCCGVLDEELVHTMRESDTLRKCFTEKSRNVNIWSRGVSPSYNNPDRHRSRQTTQKNGRDLKNDLKNYILELEEDNMMNGKPHRGKRKSAKHPNVVTGKIDEKHNNVATVKIDAEYQNVATVKTDAKYQNVATEKTDAKHQNVATEKTVAKHQNVATEKTDAKHQNVATVKTDAEYQNVATHKTDVNYHPNGAKDAIMARKPRAKRKPGKAHHQMIRNGLQRYRGCEALGKEVAHTMRESVTLRKRVRRRVSARNTNPDRHRSRPTTKKIGRDRKNDLKNHILELEDDDTDYKSTGKIHRGKGKNAKQHHRYRGD